MSRTVVLVQARMGSARLPGKSLRPLQGRPLIDHVLERAAAIPNTELVLATSEASRDDLLAERAHRLGVGVFRGPEQDVLTRLLWAATIARATTVVRVTGDCPFLDPEIATAVLEAHQATGRYAWNDTARSGFPDGTDVEVFSYDLLREAELHATLARDREHVTSWMRDHAPVITVTAPLDHSWIKLSVDTEADYLRATRIAAQLPVGDYRLASTLRAYTACAEAIGT